MTASPTLLFTDRLCWDPLDCFNVKDFDPSDTSTSGHKHDTRVPDPDPMGPASEAKDSIRSDKTIL